MICTLCPRMCAKNRDERAGDGYCRMGTLPVLARAALHFDEEPVISGQTGSGAVFFSGCCLRCAYCQNYEVSFQGYGRAVSVERLREIYGELIDQGAANINLVSPTHFTDAILQSLQTPLPVPVVWNSGGYERVETIKRLAGRVNVFLPDFKYISGEAAARYSLAPDYPKVAAAAIEQMLAQTGKVELDARGLIQKGVIIRHLILPGQAEASKRALKFIKYEFPGAWVSLMAQYVPCGEASRYPEINRVLTRSEYDDVVSYMLDIGLTDGFVQEMDAADAKYIPAFDLTGV